MGLNLNILELTIRDFHAALKDGTVTCRQLTDAYLGRINMLDQATGLNSMVVLNPHAEAQATALDRELKKGKLRPLHGVPVIVKDNYDTHDMQTSAGSIALKGSVPPDDACQVRKLREAGAVILGKSNMAEWAFSPYETVSSIAGTTRNPYDLDRVPAGSSGGTAAAVSANLGLIGLGTDTGNSIRGPSSHCCLVGVRSTMGLTSRDGIIPLYLRNDIGGPMCRTVEDAARVLDVIAGQDTSDPITAISLGIKPARYTEGLRLDGLEDVSIGVFRHYTDQPTTDPEVLKVFEKAVDNLGSGGAEITDPFKIPDFDELTQDLWCITFRRDLNMYLSTLKNPPHRSLEEIVGRGLYGDHVAERLKTMLGAPAPTCDDVYTEPKNIRLRETILKAMDDAAIDAIVYPTWSNAPRLVGDLESPHGDNSQKIPPHTGMPGINVPMGFTHGGLPAGLQIVGRLFDEASLLAIAYGYEKATRNRRPPKLFSK